MWLDQKPKPRPMLLRMGQRDFLPLGKVAMFAAPGGTGKSQSLTQLAISIASGTSWFGKFESISQGRVLLAFGEEDEEEIMRRLQASVQGLGLNAEQKEAVLSNVCAMSLHGLPARLQDDADDPTPFAEKLLSHLREQAEEAREQGLPGWSLIILDPASRFMGPEAETSNSSATRFIEICERFTKLPGNPTVMLAHHTPKSALATAVQDRNQGAARGSTALVDGARLLLTLFKAKEQPLDGARMLELDVLKTNYTPPIDPVKLKIVDGGAIMPLSSYEAEQLKEHEAAKTSPSNRRVAGATRGNTAADAAAGDYDALP